MTTPSVLAVGHLTVDDVVLHDGQARMNSLGGAALYAALGAHMVGVSSGIVSRLGHGYPAKDLNALPIVDSSLVETYDGPAIQQWVLYEADGYRTYVLHPFSGTMQELTPRPSATKIPPGVAVHLAPMHVEFQQQWCAALRGDERIVTLDPHLDSCQQDPEAVMSLLSQVTAFLPSELEARQLVDEDPVRAVEHFMSAGAPIVAFKLGDSGSLVGENGAVWRVPVSPVAVCDVTGAGDTYCGAFMAALHQGSDGLTAARWATAAASVAVEWHGAEFMHLDTAAHLVAERVKGIQPRLLADANH